MNKYNIEEIKEKLNRCKNMKLEDVTLDESNERILDFLTKVKNPYVFKVNGKLVRIRFSGNTNLTADNCLTRVLKNLYK